MKTRFAITLLLFSMLVAAASVLHGCGHGGSEPTAPVNFYGAGS